MAAYDSVPQTATLKLDRHKVYLQDEKIEELQQLLKLSRIGPATYENLHADPSSSKFGVTRDWLIHAKEEWQAFNWRTVEDHINAFPNYKVTIDDINLHFVALFSDKVDAVPLILLHGWPGSFLEYLPLLRLMQKEYSSSNLPYHLIVPSLPGYGFSSGPPLDRDFTSLEVAEIMNKLMAGLGFEKTGYIAQGGDFGSKISRILGVKYDACKAVHLNCCIMPPPENADMKSLTDRERAWVERGKAFGTTESAYAKAHASRPATMGLLLSTNPLALLIWIGEKFLEWTDENPPLNEILASVSLYWLTDTYPRSIYLYRESFGPNPKHHGTPSRYLNKPLGYSLFPREVFPVPVSWVGTTGKLCFTSIHDKGGHFGAFEQPELLKNDLENFVAQVWGKEAEFQA